MLGFIKSTISELITDDSGRISLAKNILLFGMLSATAFCWKLIIFNTFNEYYFGLYLAAITGHANWSKILDKKNAAASVSEPEPATEEKK